MDTDWCDWLAEGLIGNGCQYLSIALLEGTETVQKRVQIAAERLNYPLISDQTISEKIGYEVALTYSYGRKRSALFTHGFSLPVAMDPLMSSIYTGVAGGFVIITLDSTPPLPYSSHCDPVSLAMFAKMPALELAKFSDLPNGLKQAFTLSEKYETPVMLHLDTKIPKGTYTYHAKGGRKRKTDFEKNPARWAATPRFRFLLHKKLNQRLKKIADAETRDLIHVAEADDRRLGIICNHANLTLVAPWAEKHKASILSVAMPFPLSVRSITPFIEAHETVVVIEDRFPTIQFQLPQREKVLGRWNAPLFRQVFTWDKKSMVQALKTLKESKDSTKIFPEFQGETKASTHVPLSNVLEHLKAKGDPFVLVADKTPLTVGLPVDHFVSRGGAISVAAGFDHAGAPGATVLGITDSSAFLHYGMQATVNAIYNTSRVKCLLLIRPEHADILRSFLGNMEHVETIAFNPSAKNALKKLKAPASRAITFYILSMEEAA